MASYQDELDRLKFSPEEKAELTRRLTAERTTATARRRGLPYRGLVAAVAALIALYVLLIAVKNRKEAK